MAIEVNDRVTRAIEREVQAGKSEERQARRVLDEAIERAERREWAHKKYGDERRWRE